MSSHKIDSTPIPTPQKFEINTFDIKRETRLSSGKMVIDIVATKKRFSLTYTDLTGVQLNNILDLIYGAAFVNYEYPTETGTSTTLVTRGETPRELWSNFGDKRYRGIRIELIEQ